ncbi:MAG: FecR domain-containing protein [Anaerolineaceae bacterium]|nr:FecR domain-containing protein [Anaerolineaceae bacterium]
MKITKKAARRNPYILVILGMILLSCAIPLSQINPAAPTQSNPDPMDLTEARLTSISGEALARLPEQAAFGAVSEPVILPVKSQVKTLQDSHARLDLATGTIVRLGPNTLFTLEVQQNGADGLFTRLWMETGQVWVILKGGTLEIETPSGLAAVRGSYISASYNPNTRWMSVNCLEGFCSLQNSKGRVEMLAGQASDILDVNLPPRERQMDNTEVQSWLWNHPEATQVIPQLTQTVAAMSTITAEVSKTVKAQTETSPTVTSTLKLNPTFTFTPPIQITALPAPAVSLVRNAECRVGPGTAYPLIGSIAAGWTVPVVGRGTDGSWIVRYPYQTSIACWIPANAALPTSQSVWNVPVYAPPPLQNLTATPEPKPSKTPQPDFTSTPEPVEPSRTPTITNPPAPNSPPIVSNPVGPTGSITVCSNPYSVKATDPDGIASVKVQYAINDSSFSAPRYAGPLTTVSGNTYSGNLILSGTAAADNVYWRFIVKDTRGMFSYSYPFMYDDTVGCP